MFAFERVPEDTANLLALDRKIAEQAHAFLGEIELKVQSPDVMREKVMLIAERTQAQAILHALFQQHMSMVLRRCQSDVIADEWQKEALVVFSRDDRFIDRASLLAHALADRCFESKKYAQAEIWANRSIKEAERVGKALPWLADAWRISGQALSDDNLGPEVEARLRKSVALWHEQRSPDPIRAMLAFMGLGMFLLEVGKLVEAERALIEAVAFAKVLPGEAKMLAAAPERVLNKIRTR
jgi:hypothetical protein